MNSDREIRLQAMEETLRSLGRDPDHRIMTKEMCANLTAVVCMMDGQPERCEKKHTAMLSYLASHPGAVVFLDGNLQEAVRQASACLRGAQGARRAPAPL